MKKIKPLIGKVMASVTNVNDEMLVFTTTDGTTFRFLHFQDCCEFVRIESIVGDLNDLVGEPILIAEERTNSDVGDYDYRDDSHTWTFYTFATRKGYVDVRWLGESNGYYSEAVYFEEVAMMH